MACKRMADLWMGDEPAKVSRQSFMNGRQGITGLWTEAREEEGKDRERDRWS